MLEKLKIQNLGQRTQDEQPARADQDPLNSVSLTYCTR